MRWVLISRFCALSGYMGRRFKKCLIGTITSRAATDILVGAPACRLWTKVGTTLCSRCVHYCPWNGEGWGCSASTVNRLLGIEPPPCRGSQFIERRSIRIIDGQIEERSREAGSDAGSL